jgi:methyltransferase family protein
LSEILCLATAFQAARNDHSGGELVDDFKNAIMKTFLYQLLFSVGTLAIGFWNFISFPFSRRSRWRNSRMWASASDPFVLERVSLSALLPDPFLLTLGPLRSESHNTTEYEVLCLAAIVKTTGATSVFEIGTYDGRSARAMAMNLPESGRLYTLNLPPGNDCNTAGIQNVDSMLNTKVISGFRFLETPEEAKIQQLFGDSAAFDFKPYEGLMNLVFIDGSHTFDYVQKDTESALRLLDPSGGWIVWHDAPLYGVAPYLKQKMKRSGWPVRLIEGTTLAVAYAEQGRAITWPEFIVNTGKFTTRQS